MEEMLPKEHHFFLKLLCELEKKCERKQHADTLAFLALERGILSTTQASMGHP
jgi:hypothetical protein